METMKHQRAPQGRGRHEFTAVDAVLLMLVLITVVGAVFGWVYQALDDNTDLESHWVVTFRVTDTHHAVTDGLVVGDRLYVAQDDSFLGYLRNDLRVQAPDDEPDYVTGTGSMLCSGVLEDRSLIIGDDRCLTPGDTLVIRTEREIFTVTVLEIAQSGK